jgi:hypothetical protein
MKHVEENTIVADASTYQKSGEVTSCREAATIGSEPSKKQRSEPKLKERNRLLDARQNCKKSSKAITNSEMVWENRFYCFSILLCHGEKVATETDGSWPGEARSIKTKPKSSMHLSHNAAGIEDHGG